MGVLLWCGWVGGERFVCHSFIFCSGVFYLGLVVHSFLYLFSCLVLSLLLGFALGFWFLGLGNLVVVL